VYNAAFQSKEPGKKGMVILRLLRQQWFLLGLLGIAGLTLLDATGVIAGGGRWLKAHYGPNGVIAVIFFLSGLILRSEEIRSGLGDVKGTVAAMSVIVLLAPFAGWVVNLLPLTPGLRIGLFLVAVMPTTLTTGMVMTGAAGGNMAHALLITILSNALGVLTVPVSLSLLMGLGKEMEMVPIDRSALMMQIALLVMVPLVLGMAAKKKGDAFGPALRRAVPVINQCLVLAILWMALSEARSTVVGGGAQSAISVLLLSFVYHALLVAAAFGLSRILDLGAGRRESVVFMGGQKTLPLSILIQTTLFPQHGLALAFCIVHHFVHLIMDGYLVSWFKRRGHLQ
jgi:solute carrier family 10 (sodium/bile acid cotransporter), member 7